MDQNFGKMVLALANALVKRRNSVASRYGLTAGQMALMVYLFRNQDCPEINQSDLENEFLLTHQTVAGVVGRLEKKGFISCSLSLRDKRSKRIVLTPEANAIEDDLNLLSQESDSRLVNGMSDPEKQQFYQYLEQALQNLRTTK